jgi:DNA polymerase III delta prime subunit
MATMYPPRIATGTQSRGEVEVFRRLRDDPGTDDWFVLHSLDIVNHETQVAGEIDFIIIVPGQGVVCLEVKGCRTLRRENGLWYYGSNPRPDARGPFKQAAEAMHSIRRYVTGRDSNLHNTVFWSAVLFPFVEFSVISSEWHSWQVIDSRDFRSNPLSDLVSRVLMNALRFLQEQTAVTWFDPNDARPTHAESQQLAHLLRPYFEFFEPPEVRATRRAEEVKHYTEEQFSALDGMEMNKRAIFAGPAGTGKTLLAIEAARRSALSGKRVLLLCFNRLLGQWLREQTNSLSAVTTSTLHSYMLSVANMQPPDNASSEFWSKRLPELAIDELLRRVGDNPFVYDVLIIDEAQDILSSQYLDVLDLSLRGGLASGEWRIFGDFERQTIFGPEATEIKEILIERFGQVPRYSLRANCRNTPRIAEIIRLLTGMTPGYRRILRPDNRVEPVIHTYATDNQQRKMLIKSIEHCVDEGILPQDIVIISPRTGETAAISLLGEKWSSRLQPLKELQEADIRSDERIKFGTIHYFKGMEAPAVIVTDIEEIATQRATALLYIALSRALHRLVILVSEEARRDLLEVLSERAQNEQGEQNVRFT